MAEGLAGAGASVVLVGRDPEKARIRLEKIAANGGKAWFQSCEVTSRENIQAMLNTVLEKAGRVDILINGAGVNSPTPFLEISEEEFDRIIDINLKSLFQSCQVFGEYFVKNQIPASIINLGSMSGITPLSRVFTYSLSKAAVHNLTKNLAREWAQAGIRVNTVVPGFFPAEQNKKVLTPERVGQIMGHTPMKRFGVAHELIGVTVLLASQAGAFITGSEVVVDGGFHAMTI